MKKNSKWLELELRKDKREIKTHKSKIIREILKTPKKEITTGPQKKPSKWKIIKMKIRQFFKL